MRVVTKSFERWIEPDSQAQIACSFCRSVLLQNCYDNKGINRSIGIQLTNQGEFLPDFVEWSSGMGVFVPSGFNTIWLRNLTDKRIFVSFMVSQDMIENTRLNGDVQIQNKMIPKKDKNELDNWLPIYTEDVTNGYTTKNYQIISPNLETIGKFSDYFNKDEIENREFLVKALVNLFMKNTSRGNYFLFDTSKIKYQQSFIIELNPELIYLPIDIYFTESSKCQIEFSTSKVDYDYSTYEEHVEIISAKYDIFGNVLNNGGWAVYDGFYTQEYYDSNLFKYLRIFTINAKNLIIHF